MIIIFVLTVADKKNLLLNVNKYAQHFNTVFNFLVGIIFTKVMTWYVQSSFYENQQEEV